MIDSWTSRIVPAEFLFRDILSRKIDPYRLQRGELGELRQGLEGKVGVTSVTVTQSRT